MTASPTQTDTVHASTHAPPPESQSWWVLTAVGVGAFMTALDGSVVNTILPVVQHAFGCDVATVEWVVTIYLLALSGVMLSFGRLGDLRGHKSVYLWGFVGFVLTSVLCGLASTVTMLILMRGLQALSGAMVISTAPAILIRNFPSTQRGRAIGLLSTATYLGLTAGPALGGWLTDVLSWRAVFYMNVPVGLAALWLSVRQIPRDEPVHRTERFDLAGAGTFTAGLVALLLGLNQGHAWGWTSWGILGLLTSAAMLLVVFLWIEQRVSTPMLDLSLFRSRLFAASTASAVLNYISVYSIVFLLPFYLIQGRHLSPGQTGLILTAFPIMMAVISPVSGTLSDRIGSRLLSTTGMVVLAGGLLLLTRLGAQSPLYEVVLGLGIAGLGIGIFISPNSSALMGAAPRHRQGIASGIMATARNMGMVIGVGLSGAIFTTVMAHGGQAGTTSAIFEGVSVSFLVAAGVAVLGAVTSVARGDHRHDV